MIKDVRVIIPTKNRKKKLAKAVSSIDSRVELIVEGSDIDLDIDCSLISREFVYNEDKSEERDMSFVPAINRNCIKGKHIIVSSDDIYYEEDTIEIAYRELIARFPDTDGVIGINNYNLGTAGHEGAVTLVGDKFLDRFPDRKIFCPEYWHFYVDTELTLLAKKLGRFYFCVEARVFHDHPCITKSYDATHHYKRSERHTRDGEVWKQRQESGKLWGE